MNIIFPDIKNRIKIKMYVFERELNKRHLQVFHKRYGGVHIYYYLSSPYLGELKENIVGVWFCGYGEYLNDK